MDLRLIWVVFRDVEDTFFSAGCFLSAAVITRPGEAREIRVDFAAMRFLVDFEDIPALVEGIALGIEHAARAVEGSSHFHSLRLGQIPIWPVDRRRHPIDIDERGFARRWLERNLNLDRRIRADLASVVPRGLVFDARILFVVGRCANHLRDQHASVTRFVGILVKAVE